MSEQGINLPFGFTFVDEAEVPEAPRRRSNNTEVWKNAVQVLINFPNKWMKVHQYTDSDGAPSATNAKQKVSQINNGNDRTFPAAQYEARSSEDGFLFLRYRGTNAEIPFPEAK